MRASYAAIPVLPRPAKRYDEENESQFRRAVEQALSAGAPSISGPFVDITQRGAVPGTDATAIINALITELNTAGGGVVWVPDDFYATQIKLKSYVTVMGNGWGSTITQVAATALDLVVLENVNAQFCGMVDIALDGNKTNQSTANRGIYLDNTGGSFSVGDSHLFFNNVFINNCKGSGLVRGPGVKELRAFNVLARLCDKYGFDVSTSGGTDNFFSLCTAQANGLSGFNAAGYGDRYQGCKAFGNGTLHTSGNAAGWLISGLRVQMSACEAQENYERGFSYLNTTDCVGAGLHADANGTHAFFIDNSDRCNIFGTVCNTAGLAYTSTYALKYVNTPVDNNITLSSNGTSSGTLDNTADDATNWTCINRQYTGLLDISGGTKSGQILFPATQNASANANTLDDYEEGTWTPNVGGNTTYTLQQGAYTKVGRMVTARGRLKINAIGTGNTGIISGLPFAADVQTPGCVSYYVSLAVNVVSIGCYATATGTLVLTGLGAAAATVTAPIAVLGNGAEVMFAVTYFV